ncbi:2OG-Fe(II) oxygenase [Streptomyces cyaneofuscatus]
MSSVRDVLHNEGVVLLAAGEHPYSAAEIDEVIALCLKLPGDTGVGDENRLGVGRILVDPVDIARGERGYAPAEVEAPEIAGEILAIVASEKAMAFWAGCFGQETVTVRRAQTNFLHQGHEVGWHDDHEANPEYRFSIVIGLSDDYTGGDFVARPAPEDERRLRVDRGDVLVAKAELQHAVSTVESGRRISLVLFTA